ncbi:MAG TPA: 2-phosphosulfolactate phosphatase [Chloroflexia bacterium]|nr:2-phosphosulfolactate phosphatase [Chloroflexia bacterium]
MYYEQSEFDIRCEWGLNALTNLSPTCDVVVIVDVLSFSTCVDVAVGRGAIVYPFQWRDARAEEFARSVGAIIAGARRGEGYGLSPASLMEIAEGVRLVLPSPNGSTLSLATGGKPTFAGCLRNAHAVAQAAQRAGRRILVVPAGELWPDGALRFAIEDLIGAGAIISRLEGTCSPEAQTAVSAFEAAREELYDTLAHSSSGKELIERGFNEDVRLASLLDCSDVAPVLVDGAYQRGV